MVTANSAAVSASHLQSYGFSDLFSSNDPNNTQYQFFDLAPATGTVLTNGAVVLNGQQQASNTIVTATSLSNLSFVASGTDTLYARANDGSGWSAWAKVTVTAPADHAPSVSVLPSAGKLSTATGVSVSATQLFSATDPDATDVANLQYQFYDSAAGIGTVFINGNTLTKGTISQTISSLSSVNLTTGKGTDALFMRAYDGLTYSAWSQVAVTGAPAAAPLPTLAAPVSSAFATFDPTKHAAGFAATT